MWNLARGGTGNSLGYSSMRSALNKSAQPPDYVIQFWTELLRDKQWHLDRQPWQLAQVLDEVTQDLVDQHRRLRARLPGTRWAMIGGQAPLPPDYLELFAPEFAIEDWRAELLGRRWSYSAANVAFHAYVFGNSAVSARNRDPKKIRKDLMKEVLEFRDLLKDSELFPDGFHPGWPAYEQLLERLKQWIRSS